jgi:hypothetical protein
VNPTVVNTPELPKTDAVTFSIAKPPGITNYNY